VVAYDTTILPGREGKITPKVTIKGLHGGPVSKSIVVESNASNEPKLTLTVKAVIVSAIELRSSYVTVRSGVSMDQNPAIVLRCKKPDLRVGDLVFEPGGGGAGGGWRSTLPVLPEFKVAKSDSMIGGMWEYTIKLSVTAELTGDLGGTFRLTTNHKDKPEITVGGRIQMAK
jgi:hypothetical protein